MPSVSKASKGILVSVVALSLTMLLAVSTVCCGCMIALGYLSRKDVVVRREASNRKVTPTESTDAQVDSSPVFDVPSLIGLSMEEIRAKLGTPLDKFADPTLVQVDVLEEWHNTYERQDQELLVVFDIKSLKVKELFLTGDDKNTLLRRGGLTEESPEYRIVPVKANRNPALITGIRVISVRKDVR